MSNSLSKFKLSQPKEFVYGRVRKFTDLVNKSGEKVYQFSNLVDVINSQKAAEVISVPQEEECFFLWKPSVNNFWKYVQKHQLVIYDYISPSLIGLVIKSGNMWKPEGVAYDVDKAFELYQATYRDSALSRQKRLLKQLDEFNQLLKFVDATNSPWFIRCIQKLETGLDFKV
jgi:hypothetical protein